MKSGTEIIKMQKYKQGTDKYPILGKLQDTSKKVRLSNGGRRYTSPRVIWIDEKGDEYVSYKNKFWKFPQEVEY